MTAIASSHREIHQITASAAANVFPEEWHALTVTLAPGRRARRSRILSCADHVDALIRSLENETGEDSLSRRSVDSWWVSAEGMGAGSSFRECGDSGAI